MKLYFLQLQELPTHLKKILSDLSQSSAVIPENQIEVVEISSLASLASTSTHNLLLFDSSGLALCRYHNGKTYQRLLIDFNSSKNTYRQAHGNMRQSALARAIFGRKKSTNFTILDATAGLGKDSFDLMCLGSCVTMLERNPILYCLILDALTRYQDTNELAEKQLQLLNIDFFDYAKNNLKIKPQIVFLDPMFPARTKSASVKKEAEWLQLIAGPDLDSDDLLQTACLFATDKVVVKRPTYARPLANTTADYRITGKTVRYDVYCINLM